MSMLNPDPKANGRGSSHRPTGTIARVALVAAALVVGLLTATTVGAQREADARIPPPAPLSPDSPTRATEPVETAPILDGVLLNFHARHEEAIELAAAMQLADPTDPWPVVLETYTLYWLMLYDDEDTRYDGRIADSCDRTIALAQARLDASEDDAEAHFLMGQGLMNRGRLNGWRGEYYKAGRDGERARKHLERALELRPDWVDARFQLGLYYFFASLIPEMVTKWLGWLWFIPTGNAEEGIAFLEQVSEQGVLYREDARYMRANIYTNHVPGKRDLGLPIIRDLALRYPENVLLHFELIETLYENGLADETILEADRLASREVRAERERGWVAIALVWKARAAVLRDEPEIALELLNPYLAAPLQRPLWGMAWIDLVRGQALDVLGRRKEALVQYERVLAYEKPNDSQRAARLARESIASPYAPPRPTEISAAP